MSYRSPTGRRSVSTCTSCEREYAAGEEPDPCLGTLPGVTEACCGHGRTEKAYVMFENGVLLRGVRRIERHDVTRKGKRGR